MNYVKFFERQKMTNKECVCMGCAYSCPPFSGENNRINSNKIGLTKLMCCAENDMTEKLSDLVQQGAMVDEVDIYQRTALVWAAKNGSLGCVKFLVENGANIDGDNTMNANAPLNVSIFYQHEEVSEFLIEKGANVNHKDSSGCSPLYMAIHLEDLELVALLISYGADIGEICKDGKPIAKHFWRKLKKDIHSIRRIR